VTLGPAVKLFFGLILQPGKMKAYLTRETGKNRSLIRFNGVRRREMIKGMRGN